MAEPRFPEGIPYIVANEGAERFSFYGMRQILYIYLVGLLVRFTADNLIPADQLADAKVRATQVTHAFFGGAYMFTLLGATVADRLLGKYRTIFWVSFIYCGGHAVLAVAGNMAAHGQYATAEQLFYVGLGLIAFASGGIKPVIAANLGDQFTAENASLLRVVFQIFYYVINFGSFLSTLLTPWLYKHYGAEVAFGVPGILMFIATFIFWLGRKQFTHRAPAARPLLGLIDTFTTLALFTPIFVLLWGVLNGWNAPWNIAIATAGLAVGGALTYVRYRIEPHASIIAVIGYALAHREQGQPFFASAERRFGKEAAEGVPAVLRIALVFVMICMFWALYDQHASTWVEQARHMDLAFTVPNILWYGFALPALLLAVVFSAFWLMRYVSNKPLSRTVNIGFLALLAAWGVVATGVQLTKGTMETLRFDPAQSSALNPFIILVAIPLLNVAVFRPLERAGRPLSHLARMTIGMFLTSLSFVVVALIQAHLERHGDGSLHVMWQGIPYLMLTTGEVLVFTTALEFGYAQAPRSMKSTILGLAYLTITLGDLFVIAMAPLMKQSLSSFFWTFAALMAGAAVIFAIIAKTYRGKTYLQEATGA